MVHRLGENRFMQIRFLSQPFSANQHLGDWVAHLTAVSPPVKELVIVVAWAKRSGLSRVAAHLNSLREAGARLSMIVGIDEGGATKQGLSLAIKLFDQVHVFHDPSSRSLKVRAKT